MLSSKHIPYLMAAIMVAAVFTRLWNIPHSLQFLGDQGRDAMIVARIFRQADPVFIGPVTSVGNMYLGPLYYYFMLPFLWLSYPSPVGPAYGVAILGIITIFLMYYLGKKLVGKPAAIVGAALMTFSSVATLYSRFSWNPNPSPLVSLVMIYATYHAWRKNSWAWVVVAICFAILIQLHYLTLLSAAGAGLIWLWAIREQFTTAKSAKKTSKANSNTSLRRQLIATGVGAIFFLASLTPLMLFDSRHGWLNANSFKNMFVKEETFVRDQTTLPGKIAQTLKETHGRGMHILLEFPLGQQRTTNTILLVIILSIFLGSSYQAWRSSENSGLVVLAAYLVTGILGTSVYEHTVFDHYIAYLFPVTFLVLGYCLVWLWQTQTLTKKTQPILRISVVLFAIWYLAYNLPRMPLQNAGWTIYDMQRTSQTISDRVKPGEKYNIVLLSATGDIDGQNYRYFLETTDTPPVKLEQRGEVGTLFIINEDRELAKVTDSPVYEIVVFPDKDPKEVYTIPGGPEITVLRKADQAQNTTPE